MCLQPQYLETGIERSVRPLVSSADRTVCYKDFSRRMCQELRLPLDGTVGEEVFVIP